MYCVKLLQNFDKVWLWMHVQMMYIYAMNIILDYIL